MKGGNFFSMNYLYKGRWNSYWYQIKELSSLEGVKSILEIGPGNKIVYNVLAGMGYEVKSMDVDEQIKPDFIADIMTLPDLPKNRFDLVLCAEVLEHLPYLNFPRALGNLYQLTKRYLVITLPYTSKGTFKPYLKINLIPFLRPISWLKIFNLFPREHIVGGEHCWEIGKRGYKLGEILEDIRKSGFKIIRRYPIFENPYHYMIVCEKREK